MGSFLLGSGVGSSLGSIERGEDVLSELSRSLAEEKEIELSEVAEEGGSSSRKSCGSEMALRAPGRELREFHVWCGRGGRERLSIRCLQFRERGVGRGMVVAVSWGDSWPCSEVCRGLEPGETFRPMLTLWSIYRSVCLLRGWGSSGRMRYLLGTNWLVLRYLGG